MSSQTLLKSRPISFLRFRPKNLRQADRNLLFEHHRPQSPSARGWRGLNRLVTYTQLSAQGGNIFFAGRSGWKLDLQNYIHKRNIPDELKGHLVQAIEVTQPNIERIFIPTDISDSLLRKLRGWPVNRAQSISISEPSGKYIKPETFAALGKLNRLQSISVQFTGNFDSVIPNLHNQAPNLEEFSLQRCVIKDSTLVALATPENKIRLLEFLQCEFIDRSTGELSTLFPNLQELSMHNTPLHPGAISNVGQLDQLRCLSLSGTGINISEWLDGLPSSISLTHFAFQVAGKPYTVDARIARQITRAFPDLIELDLQNASFSSDAILEITKLPKLNDLTLHQTEIPLGSVPFLESLKIRGAHISLFKSSLPTVIQAKLDPYYNTPTKYPGRRN